MKAGMLWYDPQKDGLFQKCGRAVDYYIAKYGCAPAAIYVHPDVFSEKEAAAVANFYKIPVKSGKAITISKNHLFLERSE